MDFSLYPFAYVPKWVCTSRWAGAGLPLSYAAFISLAGLGGSCNKPLSTLRFSYVFMKASRLSRSGPSSTQSDLLEVRTPPIVRYDAAEKRKPFTRLGASAARFAFVAELTAFHFDRSRCLQLAAFCSSGARCLLHESPQLRLRHLYIDNKSAQDLPFA
ncbi:hypothetical protein LguiB_035961 [Lonicera macranthoides]